MVRNKEKMVGCIAQHPIYRLYGAEEDGTILNLRTMRRLKPETTNRGYSRIWVYKNGNPRHYCVHRFVFESFKGDIPIELQVDHINNNKQNNCIDNLQLLTPAEYCQKAPVGRRRKNARWPRIPVISICVETGERQTFPSMRAASRALGVSSGLISRIVRNKARSTQSKTTGQ